MSPKNNPFSSDFKSTLSRYVLPTIAVMAVLVFARCFSNEWTMDDFPVIVENPDIRSLGAFIDNAKPGRPLRELTYLLDYRLFGLEPTGWFVQNIFWHILNAWLVFKLIARLDTRLFVAWATALLFTVHPLVVEVVANTSHRKDSLALTFSLLALHAWIQFSRARYRKWMWLAGTLACWLLAMGAKQNAAVLPVVLWGYEIAFGAHTPTRVKRINILALAAGTVAVLGGMAAWFALDGKLMFIEGAKGLLGKMNHFSDWEVSFYYQAMLKSWVFMFWRIFWPVDLAVEYTYPLPASWLDPFVLVAMVLIMAYVAALAIAWRKSPLAFFALVWCGAFWLPTSNLWPLSYFAADRYLYAPLFGFLLLCVMLLDKLVGTQRKNLRWGVGGVLVLLLALLSFRQTEAWRTPEKLWLRAYEVSPTSSFALNNLGNISLQRGENAEALRYYQESFRINPYNPSSNYNLGFLFTILGNQEAARKHMKNFLIVADPVAYAQERANVERQLRRWPNTDGPIEQGER